jgi:hypothetical protein
MVGQEQRQRCGVWRGLLVGVEVGLEYLARRAAVHSYTRRQRSRDSFRTERIVNKLGRNQTVKRKVSSAIGTVSVKGFTRNINIPARPFLVFRPEDPERIQKQVALYVAEQGKAAGLESR